MNKIYPIISIIFLSILILGVAGCEKTVVSVENGLIMNFVENAPPKMVATDQFINIYADIANKGSSHINKGGAKFYLIGVKDNLEKVTTSLSNTKFLEEGTEERLKFAEKVKSPLELSEKEPYIFTISLKGCYPYDTEMKTKVCIAEKDNPVCSITGEKITETSNSAGPIKVTSLKEEVVANKLIITAIIENKGVAEKSIGDVYLRSANCDVLQDVTHKDYIDELLKEKKVDVEVKAEGFKCDLEEDTIGTVSLTNDKGKIICEKKIEGQTYDALLTMILRYKYQDYISTTITLIKA